MQTHYGSLYLQQMLQDVGFHDVIAEDRTDQVFINGFFIDS